MEVGDLKVDGARFIVPKVFGDERGFFLEVWNQERYARHGIGGNFQQDNHSRSAQYVLRGLHYQVNGQEQGKLVWVTRGRVFDVIVDLRESSPTFGRWDGRELTAEGHEQIWVPPGCAHGFLVLSREADSQYKSTRPYSPKDERVLRWNALDIKWPLPEGVKPILAARDSAAPDFASCEKYR